MRKFTDQELTQEEVVALLKAALMAPSSKRSTWWQFLVVDDKDMLEKLSHCKEMGAAFLADAAMAVVVMADPLASDVWIEDAAIASIMIQLQAEDLGLGSCWIQVRERFTATGMPSGEYVHTLLDIPLQLQVVSIGVAINRIELLKSNPGQVFGGRNPVQNDGFVVGQPVQEVDNRRIAGKGEKSVVPRIDQISFGEILDL